MRSLTSTVAVGAMHLLLRTKHRRVLALAACAAMLLSAAPVTAAADGASGPSILYSDAYKKLLAAFPAGYADDCAISVVLHSGGGGFCDHLVDLAYFYPDGTYGALPWVPDSSSSTGWSVPDPCDGVTVPESDVWSLYVDGTNYGWPDAPTFSEDEVECGIFTWGWWF